MKYRAEDDVDPLWSEKRREHVLRRYGYRVERVIASDVYRNWPATSHYLRPLFYRALRVG